MAKKDKKSNTSGVDKNIKTDSGQSILVDDQKIVKTEKKAVKAKKEISEVKAGAKHLRISYRKLQLVADAVRGKSVLEAQGKLIIINKAASPLILKVLNSAIANAENNYSLNKENLYIKKIAVGQGPTLKRWKPAAFGKANPIKKRTSHLELFLAVKPEGKEAKTANQKKSVEKPKKPSRKTTGAKSIK